MMVERMECCIALHPTENSAGTWLFLNLNIVAISARQTYTAVPAPDFVLDRINEIAALRTFDIDADEAREVEQDDWQGPRQEELEQDVNEDSDTDTESAFPADPEQKTEGHGAEVEPHEPWRALLHPEAGSAAGDEQAAASSEVQAVATDAFDNTVRPVRVVDMSVDNRTGDSQHTPSHVQKNSLLQTHSARKVTTKDLADAQTVRQTGGLESDGSKEFRTATRSAEPQSAMAA
ncbi:hypothetical protein FVE85_8842 [Porphyridium purpureum]|uniref:Uncharacterized protein n=1 Tax=Porphyridium purpureum TaxID=35688 RepID=A0A5J4YSI8_PORPP|nr:hypothetical protein FVE85_8842 [Porphyridium purpureum]|eukprot:POR2983..scf296_7